MALLAPQTVWRRTHAWSGGTGRAGAAGTADSDWGPVDLCLQPEALETRHHSAQPLLAGPRSGDAIRTLSLIKRSVVPCEGSPLLDPWEYETAPHEQGVTIGEIK